MNDTESKPRAARAALQVAAIAVCLVLAWWVVQYLDAHLVR